MLSPDFFDAMGISHGELTNFSVLLRVRGGFKNRKRVSNPCGIKIIAR
jgi:hypothetical protein